MAAWSGRRWSSKQYIFAALLGTLVAIAIAAAISISLAPGHVSFAVTQAKLNTVPVNRVTGLQNLFYNFTVQATISPSRRRVAVQCDSLTSEIWFNETSWIPAQSANTAAEMPGWWRHSAVAHIRADWAQFSVKADEQPSEMTNKKDDRYDTDDMDDVQWPNCLVHLKARVRFRVGLVPTKPYTVRASCFPVNFIDDFNSSVQCTS